MLEKEKRETCAICKPFGDRTVGVGWGGTVEKTEDALSAWALASV